MGKVHTIFKYDFWYFVHVISIGADLLYGQIGCFIGSAMNVMSQTSFHCTATWVAGTN